MSIKFNTLLVLWDVSSFLSPFRTAFLLLTAAGLPDTFDGSYFGSLLDIRFYFFLIQTAFLLVTAAECPSDTFNWTYFGKSSWNRFLLLPPPDCSHPLPVCIALFRLSSLMPPNAQCGSLSGHCSSSCSSKGLVIIATFFLFHSRLSSERGPHRCSYTRLRLLYNVSLEQIIKGLIAFV